VSELTKHDWWSPGERELVECYSALRGVLEERGPDLPPFARRNAIKALAALWQVANGLDAEPGPIDDLGA
jgi:hypothetical protein